MSAERDVNRIVRSWIRAEEHESADRVLQTVLSRLDTTPQRRHMWPPRRFAQVNKYAQAAIAAAAVLVVAVVGYNLLPRTGGPGGPGSPAPTADVTPVPSPAASSAFETVTLTPFGPDGFGMCPTPEVDSDCVEDPRDDGMTFTLDLPAGWESAGQYVQPVDAPFSELGGAGVLIIRGSWLHSDPCLADEEASPDVPVGPTVDDFVTALDDHPLLDVSPPMIKGIGGYTGSYLQLQAPDDISRCTVYLPISTSIYAHGPGHTWDLYVLDVEGIRVVVKATSFPSTSAQHKAELQAVVDSIRITP